MNVFQSVANRGKPTEEFITELMKWARGEDDSVFVKNPLLDIYSITADRLGPFENLVHRKAVMCEVLRVLAGFESSWRWDEGKDITNPAENSDETESAGVFQVSANSVNLHESLKEYASTFNVSRDAKAFRRLMMQDRQFAFGYTARLLRVNLRHNGPVKRREIIPWLQRDAVVSFRKALNQKGSLPS